ncbi:MAG: polyamine aminopropyltransferase [Alphaproteobacteria bacterium]|nr:polyamine aminopropyltransferase [Alphaproteobacteria bacterium]
MSITFRETLYGGYAQTMPVDGPMLADERSRYQHIQIFDSRDNGRVLVLDGIIQLTDRDECAYSEMLSHVPILEHGRVRRAMIVGGGDGAIAEEILKHGDVEHVDLVDIDDRVIDLSRIHFAHVSGTAFADPRLTVRAEDAFPFLAAEDAVGRYDLIVADRPDPVGPAEVLFAEAFYTAVSRALAPGGFACFQTGVPFYQAEELSAALAQLRQSFAHVGTYLTVTPTYTGGFMALTWASNDARLGTIGAEEIAARAARKNLHTDYYTPAIHTACFALPRFVERIIETGNAGLPKVG